MEVYGFSQNWYPGRKNDGDYLGKDGLLYCGHCNAKKQFKLTEDMAIVKFLKKSPGIYGCICICEEQQIKKYNQKNSAYERDCFIENNKKVGLRDTSYLNSTFGKDDLKNIETTKKLKDYCSNFKTEIKKNIGIFLFGEVGTGKTFSAACVANEIMNNGYSAYMSTLTDLINNLSNFDDNSRFSKLEEITDKDLLILDDYGAQRKTDFSIEQTFNIVDMRYRKRKPLIITTNIPPAILLQEQALDLRRANDRIFEMCPLILSVDGETRRKK